MIVLIDNYDSFTYNLVQKLGEVDRTRPIGVFRNDKVTVEQVEALRPTHIVISPGPCTPKEGGVSNDIIRHFGPRLPVLGVCLGHQALASAFGGRVVRGHPVHGKTAAVEHDGRTIFDGLPSPLEAGRYHSLVVDPDLPDVLERSALSGDTVMAIRHRELPAEGVQFHPESVLTAEGMAILRNFLER